jgi:hypothetical protein
MAAKISVVSCIAMPCDLAGDYQRFGETLVTTYKTTWRHNPEVHNR